MTRQLIPGLPVRLLLVRRLQSLGDIFLTVILFIPVYLFALWINRQERKMREQWEQGQPRVRSGRPASWRKDGD